MFKFKKQEAAAVKRCACGKAVTGQRKVCWACVRGTFATQKVVFA